MANSFLVSVVRSPKKILATMKKGQYFKSLAALMMMHSPRPLFFIESKNFAVSVINGLAFKTEADRVKWPSKGFLSLRHRPWLTTPTHEPSSSPKSQPELLSVALMCRCESL
jgi:hypothetical protein